MTHYQITCVRQYQGVITHVGIGNYHYTIPQIVEFMFQGHEFYTHKKGAYAKVERKWSSHSNRWFLTTNPDSILENNLDFLPSC